MHVLIKDLKYAARILIKYWGVTLVAVLTLALGIGANTAIFSGVSAFILKPLPVPHASQLVRPVEVVEESSGHDEFAYPDFVEYQKRTTSFTGMAAEVMAPAAFNSDGQNDVIWGQVVSGNYFDVLQLPSFKGRYFVSEEDSGRGAHAVVVLGHSLWERRLRSDPDIVGQMVRLNNRPYQVIGVAPENFKGTKFGLSMDFWVPMAMSDELQQSPGLLDSRNSHWLNVIARLKPGVTLSQASADLSKTASELNQLFPDSRDRSTRAQALSEIDGRWQEAALVIKSASGIAMAITGLILLIACANVANLLLARSEARRKEIGIRVALGASRISLIRQLLTESLLLALMGGVIGLILAYWSTKLMQGLIPVLQYNIVNDFFSLDTTGLVFTFVVSVLTGIVFGLAPAWQSSNLNIIPVLKGDSAHRGEGVSRRFSFRNMLVVTQVALSLTVLICSGLFIKSFRQAQTIDPGFATRNALLVSLNPQLVGYNDQRTRDFYKQIVQRASVLPGVEGAALARLIPLGDSSNSVGPVLREGESLPRGSAGRNILTNVISPGYFAAMQIPIISGRDFDNRDQEKSAAVVIVNQRMAEQLWPGESAVGKRILIGPDSHKTIEVVGVVKTGKYRSLAEDNKASFYSPLTQGWVGPMTLIVRTQLEPSSLAEPVRKEIRDIDADVPTFAVKTMETHMSWALWGPNLAATFSLAFGVVALMLSAVGLYSVMAYVVSLRTREVGIRMALGANRVDVLRMIATQGMRLALCGVAIGVLLSLALVRALSALLIGVSGYDVTTFIAVSLLLAGVAFIACYFPARRATKVDPLIALRYE